MPNKKDFEFLIPESKSKLLMINQKERQLLRLILSRTLDSEGGKKYIVERLGTEYLEIGKSLLEQMQED
ncbi:MAG: hypothetical protein PVG99_13475 [Desulfobacteraceae bacterium]